MVQLISASALIEVIVCDGSGGGGDGHICTTAAGGTAADLREKAKTKNINIDNSARNYKGATI